MAGAREPASDPADRDAVRTLQKFLYSERVCVIVSLAYFTRADGSRSGPSLSIRSLLKKSVRAGTLTRVRCWSRVVVRGSFGEPEWRGDSCRHRSSVACLSAKLRDAAGRNLSSGRPQKSRYCFVGHGGTRCFLSKRKLATKAALLPPVRGCFIKFPVQSRIS